MRCFVWRKIKQSKGPVFTTCCNNHVDCWVTGHRIYLLLEIREIFVFVDSLSAQNLFPSDIADSYGTSYIRGGKHVYGTREPLNTCRGFVNVFLVSVSKSVLKKLKFLWLVKQNVFRKHIEQAHTVIGSCWQKKIRTRMVFHRPNWLPPMFIDLAKHCDDFILTFPENIYFLHINSFPGPNSFAWGSVENLICNLLVLTTYAQNWTLGTSICVVRLIHQFSRLTKPILLNCKIPEFDRAIIWNCHCDTHWVNKMSASGTIQVTWELELFLQRPYCGVFPLVCYTIWFLHWSCLRRFFLRLLFQGWFFVNLNLL